MTPVARRIAAQALRWRVVGQTLVIGISGPQASGKSTAVAQVADHLRDQGLSVGVLSLDDLYLGRLKRLALAARIHPLFATRGPPGTHDYRLGIDVLQKVRAGNDVPLPRFSKAFDAPLARDLWPQTGACDVFLFEGWCVGARPQTSAALDAPVNALEQTEDPHATWRHAVNEYLAGEVAVLFGMIDRLVYLKPPSFDVVYAWRCEQEHALIAEGNAPAAMSDTEIARFVAHFERLTRHMMDEKPSRADLVMHLDAARNVTS